MRYDKKYLFKKYGLKKTCWNQINLILEIYYFNIIDILL